MSDSLIAKDVSEEFKVALLKHLDSLFCADKNIICIWGADDRLGLTIVETEVNNTTVEQVISTCLNVKFYINSSAQIILTTIK